MQRFKYELTLLWSGSGIKLALVFYILTAVIAVAQGAQRVAYEKKSHQIVQHQFEKNVSVWQTKIISGEEDLGLMGYYLLSPTIHKASPWATLFYGQRDLDLLQQHIRLLALEGQIHATEINNPENQITGFIDLGFVLVYLLPLIIGLMCATLYAQEETKNRWLLLTALAGSGMSVLVQRLWLRFILLTCLNFLIVGAGIVISDINVDRYTAIVFISLILYQLFWFSLCGLIIQLRLKIATSTLSFIAAWLVLIVIIPGLSNLYLANRYSTDDGIALVLKQRQVMNDAWDKDKQTSFADFLQHYPTYADATPLTEPFDWKWYYAMQHMSDIAAAPHLEEYTSVNNKRMTASDQLAWLSAPLSFHQILTQIAQTDAASHNEYLQQIRNYHHRLRDFYYARIFYKTSISEADFAALPRFEYQSSVPSTPWKNVFILIFSSMIIGAVTGYVGRNKTFF
jgi:ABC-2 type transport system permease protein